MANLHGALGEIGLRLPLVEEGARPWEMMGRVFGEGSNRCLAFLIRPKLDRVGRLGQLRRQRRET